MLKFGAGMLLTGTVFLVSLLDYPRLQSVLGLSPGYEVSIEIPETRLFTADGRLLQKDLFQGKPVYVFFGFTECGTACPVVLGKLKRLDAQLRKSGNKAEFVYINLKPLNNREAAGLSAFFSEYPENFHALYAEDIRELKKITGVLHADADFRFFNPDQHTAFIYLTDSFQTVKRIYTERNISVSELAEGYTGKKL